MTPSLRWAEGRSKEGENQMHGRARGSIGLITLGAIFVAIVVPFTTFASPVGATDIRTLAPTSTACAPPPNVPADGTLVRVPTTGTAHAVAGTMTAPNGSVIPLRVRCSWRVTIGGGAGPLSRSVTYTQGTSEYMALGTSYSFGVHFDGVNCTSTGEVLNGFGGGGAQAKLVQTHCNTYTGFSTALGTVEIVGGTYVTGPLKFLTYFGTPVQTSFVSGHSVFYGVFQDCSEDPVGQTTHFACVYWTGSPL